MSYDKYFDESYARVVTHPVTDKDFFLVFYHNFISASPEASKLLENTDLTKQAQMFKKSFYSLLVFYASNAADDYLERIAYSHSRAKMTIPPHLYDIWLETLIETVKMCDPKCCPNVELAWRLVLVGGITYMKFKY